MLRLRIGSWTTESPAPPPESDERGAQVVLSFSGSGRYDPAMPYWLAKLLGRADGPEVAKCGVCDEAFPSANGVRVTGVAGLVCSAECAEHGLNSMAW